MLAEQVQTRTIRPFRSYRKLSVPVNRALPCLIVTAIAEILVIAFLQPLLNVVSAVDARLVAASGVPVTVGTNHFLWLTLAPLQFTMPTHTYVDLTIWMLLCAFCIAVVSIFRLFPRPARYFVNFNLLIVACEALYLLFVGHLGYAAGTFSTLVLRTMTAIWLVLPIFIGVISTLFPFSLGTSIFLIIASFIYEIVLSIARYAAFAIILSHVGPILMSAMYLSLGPLLDVIPLSGIFAICLALLARRLRRDVEAWSWL